jgi:uncharacterized protein (DUF302 family)
MARQSKHSYSDTVARLLKAMTDAGNTIFATIDQTRAAASAGLTLRPTSLIIFGNPKGGTPVMDAFPLFALELPLKMLVWEEDGTVKVGYAQMSEIAHRYGITGKDAQIAAMDHALDTLSATVT